MGSCVIPSASRSLKEGYTRGHSDVLFSSVQLLSRLRLFATPWTAARQASLSITSSGSLLKLMSIESVMPSNHLILCRPLLLLPSIFPSIRVFSNESVLHIRWPKYWSFSFSISPSLAPWTETEPAPCALGCKIFTTEPPGKSLEYIHSIE